MASLNAIILAAGKGTRMRSDLPKVVHEVAGRPMVAWVVDACAEAGCDRIVVVVGYRQELVREALANWRSPSGRDPIIEFAVQQEQHGTGHAVACAEPALGDLAKNADASIFVLAGDGPLVRASTLSTIHDRHARTGAAATLATAVIDDPSGYGRIVRDGHGAFRAIVEEKNATDEQRAIREVNPSYYCFNAEALFETLPLVQRNDRSGEYYITDVPALLLERGARVELIDAVPPEDVLSINTQAQLDEVDRILRARLAGATPQETRA